MENARVSVLNVNKMSESSIKTSTVPSPAASESHLNKPLKKLSKTSKVPSPASSEGNLDEPPEQPLPSRTSLSSTSSLKSLLKKPTSKHSSILSIKSKKNTVNILEPDGVSFSALRQSSRFTKGSIWSTLQGEDRPEEPDPIANIGDDNAYTCIKKVYNEVSESLAKGINQGLNLEPLREIFDHVWKNVQLSHSNEQRLIAENLQVSVISIHFYFTWPFWTFFDIHSFFFASARPNSNSSKIPLHPQPGRIQPWVLAKIGFKTHKCLEPSCRRNWTRTRCYPKDCST